jgi:uracil-DNA glycosylase
MFIGGGPGEHDEVEGRPFIGKSGIILRQVIEKLNLNGCCYITNVVACRSCSQAYNGEGQPVMRYDRATKTRVPFIKDDAPQPLQIAACLPRLYEEIYLVDPVLIVTLGPDAAKAIISERSFSITSERGKTREINIPGAWRTPSLTDKKKMWLRRVRGQDIMPTTQRRVRYLMLPTLHPAYVLQRQADQSYKNPLDVFLQDMKLAARIYDDYLNKSFDVVSGEREVTINDLAEMNNA